MFEDVLRVLAGPRRRRLPGRRGARPVQGGEPARPGRRGRRAGRQRGRREHRRRQHGRADPARRADVGPARGARRLPPLARDPRPSTTATGCSWPRPGPRRPESMARFVRPDEMSQSFNFSWLLADWSAEAFAEVITGTLAALAPVGATPTWVLSNHDVVRHATRYGGGAAGPGPREGGHADDAGAARLVVPLPGRGARPGAGRGRARVPPGPVLVPHRRARPRRLPGADPVGRRRGRRSGSARAPGSRGSRSRPSGRRCTSRPRRATRSRRWRSTAPRWPRGVRSPPPRATTSSCSTSAADVLAFRRGPVTVVLNCGTAPVAAARGRGADGERSGRRHAAGRHRGLAG